MGVVVFDVLGENGFTLAPSQYEHPWPSRLSGRSKYTFGTVADGSRVTILLTLDSKRVRLNRTVILRCAPSRTRK